MKKNIQKIKDFEMILANAFGFPTPKVMGAVPLKKHLVKQLEKFAKKTEEISKKASDYFEGQNELRKLKDEFWKEVYKDVKAETTQELKINTKDLTVEFIES